ncbi:MAG: DNA polymerase III sliding clamp [Metallosphaera yellowstonensis]|jgi:proliferating cell nuclear antigen|uniref:DNA polymerase sliding clamp n=1 Tax=Metallosphaera yellowstonensis MK1 TaxID=671065 RepID=H2C8N9_9CREN|nr:DNA polymerase III sliding clamp [Metallosphaera yellowstonensis]EHP68515.1 DNA polymerase sliding clamp subunit [Metallosphaera yellowstonensis MK1]
MKFKAVDAVSIASILRTVGEFMPEVTLVSTKEGLRLGGVDPSRVAYVDIVIPSLYFQEFESGEREVIGIKLEDVINALKNVKKNDGLTFFTNEGKLELTIEGDFERSFIIPLVELEEPKNPGINLQFAFKAKMLTSTFNETLDILSDMGESVVISSEDGKLIISVEGDVGVSRVELSEAAGNLIEASGTNASSVYGLDYLLKTTKMRNSSDVVELMFGTQLPLKLRFQLPQEGYGDVYIAPRAE